MSVDGGSTARYLHDYQGRRVAKVTSSETRIYNWEVTGEVFWETPLGASQPDTARAYLNGKLISETKEGVGSHSIFSDHLGSARFKADLTTGVPYSSDAYHPFGQRNGPSNPDDDHSRAFTGKERDNESGLDYFGARFYQSLNGRFISMDPLLDSADLSNPQSWNRFSYTLNNPVRFIDPFGAEEKESVPDLLDLAIAFGTGFLKESANATVNTARFVLSSTPFLGGLLGLENESRRLGGEIGKAARELLTDPLAMQEVMESLRPEIRQQFLELQTMNPESMAEGMGQLFAVVVPSGPAIQRFADKYQKTVILVGSRARGTSTAISDFDYIIVDANSKIRKKAKRELPRGPRTPDHEGIDFVDGPLIPGEPHVIFKPRPAEGSNQ